MGDEAFRDLSKVDPNGGKLLDDVSNGLPFVFILLTASCRIEFSLQQRMLAFSACLLLYKKQFLHQDSFPLDYRALGSACCCGAGR